MNESPTSAFIVPQKISIPNNKILIFCLFINVICKSQVVDAGLS
jgi:hypothetical protein